MLYDALREYLEALSIMNGYKMYNHECYSAFLKEILNKQTEAETFDKVRKIRNSINYYGKKVDAQESKEVIKIIKTLLTEVKGWLK